MECLTSLATLPQAGESLYEQFINMSLKTEWRGVGCAGELTVLIFNPFDYCYYSCEIS